MVGPYSPLECHGFWVVFNIPVYFKMEYLKFQKCSFPVSDFKQGNFMRSSSQILRSFWSVNQGSLTLPRAPSQHQTLNENVFLKSQAFPSIKCEEGRFCSNWKCSTTAGYMRMLACLYACVCMCFLVNTSEMNLILCPL